jgi:hypothetical protein
MEMHWPSCTGIAAGTGRVPAPDPARVVDRRFGFAGRGRRIVQPFLAGVVLLLLHSLRR